MKKIRFTSILILIALILIILIPSTFSCQKKGDSLRIYEVREDELIIYVEADCIVSSKEIANLGFEVGGKIEELISEGEKIKTGDIIALLGVDDINYEKELIRQQIEILSRETELAKIELENALDKNHVIIQLMDMYSQIAEVEKHGAYLSWEDAEHYLDEVKDSGLYDEATEALALASAHGAEVYFNIADLQTGKTYWELLSKKEAAENAIAAANMNLELIEENKVLLEKQIGKLDLSLNKAEIKSPIDGEAVEVFLNVGEVVNPGQLVVSIINLEQKEVIADIYEYDAGKIETGLDVKISLDTYPDKIFMGKINRISNQSTDIMGIFYYKAYIDFASSDLNMPMGLSGDVNIITKKIENTIIIPSDAIKKRGEQDFVYLKDEEDNIKETEIKIGSSNNNFSQITEGLKVGDNIVFPEDF